ncbi:MAG: U32 family peptidase, partial [Clostridia bacterium]|nr:U32 family peptidase [Clostridia bacterium]
MNFSLRPPELLAPAGNPEKLLYALRYGADAVYLSGEQFGMRAAAGNFSIEELEKAVKKVHSLGKKVYLTVNTMPRNQEIPELEEYLKRVGDLKPDAVIVADLGVFSLCRKLIEHIPVHISTQGANVNWVSCLEWHKMGAKRVVLARELSLDEIKLIREKTPPELEIEVFVHGAMCVSFSGRCLLSEYYTGRDANRGSCTQPCRWIYHFSEEKRLSEQLDAEIHEEGTYIFGSKDMCLIDHIPELVRAGIDCFKIEGRMKSSYYTAAVTNAYRMELDRFISDPVSYSTDPRSQRELDGVSHREYCTGYFFSHPLLDANLASAPGYLKEKSFLAVVESRDEKTGLYRCIQKNKMDISKEVEYLTPGQYGKKMTIEAIYDENMQP